MNDERSMMNDYCSMMNDEFVYASVSVIVSDIDACRGPEPEGDKSGRGSGTLPAKPF